MTRYIRCLRPVKTGDIATVAEWCGPPWGGIVVKVGGRSERQCRITIIDHPAQRNPLPPGFSAGTVAHASISELWALREIRDAQTSG